MRTLYVKGARIVFTNDTTFFKVCADFQRVVDEKVNQERKRRAAAEQRSYLADLWRQIEQTDDNDPRLAVLQAAYSDAHKDAYGVRFVPEKRSY